MKAYNDPDRPWYRIREPFSDEEEWQTERGTAVVVGETVLAKPQYIDQRLPAVVEKIYWVPQGVPGGDHDHDDGHECILNVQFRFDVPDGHEYDHMDGKTHRTEAYNLDFVVGTDAEIRRDRANCNTEAH